MMSPMPAPGPVPTKGPKIAAIGVSALIAGVLADFVFEPAMSADTPMAAIFGPLVGTGPGAGMGLIMVLCGLLGLMVPVIAFFIPAIRNAESILPDHDQPAPAAA